MKANLMNGTIEMTKEEAKSAGKLNSDKFMELKEYQTAYPTFTICIVKAPKRKSEYRGLTYRFMETYIKNCQKEDKATILEEFNTLRGADNENRSACEKGETASYLDVKEWFLKKFPEIKQFKEEQHKKIANILDVA